MVCASAIGLFAQETTDTSKLKFPIEDYYDFTDKKTSPISLGDPKNINTSITLKQVYTKSTKQWVGLIIAIQLP